MKKIFTLMIAIFAMAGMAKASTTLASTTLWEGTDNGSDIYIAKEKLVAGATITLEFNWHDTNAAKFSCYYWDGSAWQYYYDYKWVNNGETFSFSLTQDQIDAIPSQLGFKHQEFDNTIKKISIEATSITEWEGTDDGSDIFIAKSRLIAGAPITLEFNWLDSNGAKFSCFYWDGSAWQNFYNYQWVNNGNTFTFWLTQTQIDAIPSQLGFKHVELANTIKKISIFKPCVSVTIGSDEIATFSSDKDLDFSATKVTPYYASAVAKGSVTLTPATNATTWNYQGYILQGPEGTYDVPVTASATSATYPDGNYLKGQVGEGTVSASTIGRYHYIFAKKKTGDANIGFYKLTDDHTLGAKKAYLETETDIIPDDYTPSDPSEARGITLDFGDGTTAILDVFQDETHQNTLREDGKYYTLQGTCVERPTKGLYILNGKKVLVK